MVYIPYTICHYENTKFADLVAGSINYLRSLRGNISSAKFDDAVNSESEDLWLQNTSYNEAYFYTAVYA